MDDVLMQLGVGGILTYLLVKEILAFLIKWRGKHDNPGNNPGRPVDHEGTPLERRGACAAVGEQVGELRLAQQEHNIHAQRDRQDTKECMQRIEDGLNNHGAVLREIAVSTSGTHQAVSDLRDRLTTLCAHLETRK